MNDVRVIVTRKLPSGTEARLRELFHTKFNPSDHQFSQEELIAAVGEADVLVCTLTDSIDAKVIAAAGPQLKLIANFGAGVDHIDLEATRAKKIMVTNTPSVLTDDTADMAMALILAAPRRVAEATQLMRAGKWPGWSPTFLMGRRVAGKKLGMVGMGRIGQAVARRARGFGLDVHYHQPRQLHRSVEEELSLTYWESLDAMLPEVDIVSLHCPYNETTKRLLTAERIASMKKESYLINTARGALVDEAALIEALKTHAIAGAGLDVYQNAPNINPAFYEIPNVTLLPHISSSTIESRDEMGEKVVINIYTFASGERPPDRVLAE